MEEIIERVNREGANVMIASHNQNSLAKTVAKMQECGVGKTDGVFFGQLLGMADHLSYTLGLNGYAVYK